MPRSQRRYRVSVVIPVYNMAGYVGSCIESVLRSDFDAIEVIVIDDGSTDETQSVVERYTKEQYEEYDPRVTYLYQSNKGKSRAVNRGFSIARGDYLTIVDADDQLAVCSIGVRYKAAQKEKSTNCDLVIGAFEVFRGEQAYGVRRPPKNPDPKCLHDRFYLQWRTPFHLNAGLFSRGLVSRVGGLDESLHRCIDGDYALRLLQSANRITTVEDVVYRYRKHRTSSLDRLKFRLKTARYRPRVIWKNYNGWRRWLGVPFGIVMDGGKLIYEMAFTYRA